MAFADVTRESQMFFMMMFVFSHTVKYFTGNYKALKVLMRTGGCMGGPSCAVPVLH